MTIQITCVCGQQYPVSDELAGQQVRCRLCGQVLTVPGSIRPGPRLKTPEPTSPAPQRSTSAPVPPRDREVEEDPGSGTSIVPLLVAVFLVLGLMGGGLAFVLLMQSDDPPKDRDSAPRVADKDKPGERPEDDGEPRPGLGKEPEEDGPGIKKGDTDPKPPDDDRKGGERKPPDDGEKKPPNDGEKKPPDDGEKKPPDGGEKKPPDGEKKPPPPPPPPPPKEPHAPFVGHASPILNVAFSRDG